MKKNEFFVFLDFYQINLCIRDLIDYQANPSKITMEMFENAKTFFNLAIEPDRPIASFLNQKEIEQGAKFFATLKEFARDTFEDFRYFEIVNSTSIKPIEARRSEYYEKILVIHQSFEYIIKGMLKDYRANNMANEELEKLVDIDEEFYRLHFVNVIYHLLLNISSGFNENMRKNNGNMSLEDQFTLNSLKELISYFYDLKNKYTGNNKEITTIFEEALNVLKVMDGTAKKSADELVIDINSLKEKFMKLGANLMEKWIELYRGIVAKYQNEK